MRLNRRKNIKRNRTRYNYRANEKANRAKRSHKIKSIQHADMFVLYATRGILTGTPPRYYPDKHDEIFNKAFQNPYLTEEYRKYLEHRQLVLQTELEHYDLFMPQPLKLAKSRPTLESIMKRSPF